jgi:hypothetical protein
MILAEKLLSDNVPVTLRSTACGGTVNNKRKTICKMPNKPAVTNANLTRRGSAEKPDLVHCMTVAKRLLPLIPPQAIAPKMIHNKRADASSTTK